MDRKDPGGILTGDAELGKPGDLEKPAVTYAPPSLKNADLKLALRDGRTVLVVEATATDVYGDDAEIRYEWVKNGERVADGPEFDDFHRDDRIEVKVEPFDGRNYGVPNTLSMTITNSPPVVQVNEEYTFDGTVYRQQVIAEDPDQDRLVYELTTVPAGMTIDAETGMISWEPGPGTFGAFPGAVRVSDGHGGTASYEFTVTLNETAATGGDVPAPGGQGTREEIP